MSWYSLSFGCWSYFLNLQIFECNTLSWVAMILCGKNDLNIFKRGNQKCYINKIFIKNQQLDF